MRHHVDNFTDDGEGDDEVVEVSLEMVPASINKVVFAVSIHDADARLQNFGEVRNAFIRVVDKLTQTEVALYDLTEDASTETAMVFGEFYGHGEDWKLHAVVQGYAFGMASIATDFGVNVA